MQKLNDYAKAQRELMKPPVDAAEMLAMFEGEPLLSIGDDVLRDAARNVRDLLCSQIETFQSSLSGDEEAGLIVCGLNPIRPCEIRQEEASVVVDGIDDIGRQARLVLPCSQPTVMLIALAKIGETPHRLDMSAIETSAG